MNSTSGSPVPGSNEPQASSRDLALAFARFGPVFGKWVSAGVTATTYPRLMLLRVLLHEGPQIMSVVGERLGVTPRNVTVLVDGLEAEGLARRVAHPEDRRATLIELTDSGRNVVADAFEQHVARVSALFDCLDAGEQDVLLRAINKLADELIAHGGSPACGPPDVRR